MSHLPYGANIELTNGSDEVEGDLTAFLANLKPGDFFQAPDDEVYFVNSIEGNTALTLNRNYGGSTGSASVWFARNSERWASVADAHTLLARIATALGRGGAMTSATSLLIGTGAKTLFVEPGQWITPGAVLSLTSRANNANTMAGVVTDYDAATGELDMTIAVTGGSGTFADWNVNIAGTVGPQGPAGNDGADGSDGNDGAPGAAGDDGADGADGADGISFTPKGPYSGATAYVPNDVVSNAGSSWVCILASTGNAPPTLPTTSNTYWELVAARGSDGAGTGDVVGPSGATDDRVAVFDGATGKLLKDGGSTIAGIIASAVGTIRDSVDAAYDTLSEIRTIILAVLAKTDWITVSQAVNLDTIKSQAASALQQGRHSLVIPAAAWAPTITNGCGRSFTELATNDLMSETVDFDTTTQEFATFQWVPDKKWNAGTLTYRVRWRCTGGSSAQTLDMALSAIAISNDDAEDAAPGTAVVVTDTWIANGDHHVSPESAAVTVAGTPAKGDTVFFRLQRNVSTDNLAGDALIESVEIFWTSDATTDT